MKNLSLVAQEIMEILVFVFLIYNSDECNNIEGYSINNLEGKYYVVSGDNCNGYPDLIQNNIDTTINIEVEKELEKE